QRGPGARPLAPLRCRGAQLLRLAGAGSSAPAARPGALTSRPPPNRRARSRTQRGRGRGRGAGRAEGSAGGGSPAPRGPGCVLRYGWPALGPLSARGCGSSNRHCGSRVELARGGLRSSRPGRRRGASTSDSRGHGNDCTHTHPQGRSTSQTLREGKGYRREESGWPWALEVRCLPSCRAEDGPICTASPSLEALLPMALPKSAAEWDMGSWIRVMHP
ncbi:PREDICTED: uncharacterized protein LOC106147057, partial [Chinchilla lanigera]|uniref:uncharacterized protein LOC106147057 n=1 Tax=Chinchilla lanigera TaxID=34839 RepID=UPI000697D20D